MNMERKYPTREVDGVGVPQMGIKDADQAVCVDS